MIKPTSHTTQPIWVKTTKHKKTCANLSQLFQDACVPVPNQSYTCVNLIKFYDSQPTLLTWPFTSRDTFEKPRDFTYGQPNFVQSHSTQWHHNQPQSQSMNTWHLNMIYLNQITSPKKIKELTNYVKLCQSHKLLDTKGVFTPLKSSQQIKQISSK